MDQHDRFGDASQSQFSPQSSLFIFGLGSAISQGFQQAVDMAELFLGDCVKETWQDRVPEGD